MTHKFKRTVTWEETKDKYYSFKSNQTKGSGIVGSLQDVYGILKTTSAQRKTHRGELAVLGAQLKEMRAKNASEYDTSRVEKQIEAAKQFHREFELAQRIKALDAIDRVRDESKKNHGTFPTRDKIPGVLVAISSIGKAGMTPDIFDSIVSPLLLDQSALKIIQAALKTNNITVGQGVLNNLIYDESGEFSKISQLASNAFGSLDGNLNGVSTALSKLVAKDGVVCETVVDQDGITEAFRKGAGLTTTQAESDINAQEA